MKTIERARRHKRITRNKKGTAERPRLVVFRSKKNMFAQIVDDRSNKVLTGCSTLSKEYKDKKIKSSDCNAAREVGKLIAQKISALGVTKVFFDRAGYRYQGRVKALAEGAREGGLKF